MSCNYERLSISYEIHRQGSDLVLHYFLETSDAQLLLEFVEYLGLHYFLLKALKLRVGAFCLENYVTSTLTFGFIAR